MEETKDNIIAQAILQKIKSKIKDGSQIKSNTCYECSVDDMDIRVRGSVFIYLYVNNIKIDCSEKFITEINAYLKNLFDLDKKTKLEKSKDELIEKLKCQ